MELAKLRDRAPLELARAVLALPDAALRRLFGEPPPLATGLDPQARIEVWRTVRELAASHGFVVDPARSDIDALCYTLDLTAAEPVAEAPADPRDTTAA